MTKTEFIKKCVALYGQRWQTTASRPLKVSRVTIQRWARGEYNIPVEKAALVDKLIDRKIDQLIDLL